MISAKEAYIRSFEEGIRNRKILIQINLISKVVYESIKRGDISRSLEELPMIEVQNYFEDLGYKFIKKEGSILISWWCDPNIHYNT